MSKDSSTDRIVAAWRNRSEFWQGKAEELATSVSELKARVFDLTDQVIALKAQLDEYEGQAEDIFGWARPADATQWHFFAGDEYSLCFNWYAPDSPLIVKDLDTFPELERYANCPACQTKYNELVARGLITGEEI